MNTFSIFKGNSKTMSLRIDNDDCCGGGPLDLTNCIEIDIALPNADGTFSHLFLSDDDVSITVPAILGKFSAVISAEISALLNVGEFQDLNVTLTLPSEKTTVRFQGALSVFEIN